MIRLVNRLVTAPWFQRFVDQRRVARLFGALADSRLPRPLLRRIIAAYSRAFAIVADDFDFTPARARTFNDFFTRPLKPGRRPLGPGIVSPADGHLCAGGPLEEGRLVAVKGQTLALDELLGEPLPFASGGYAIVYLSPGDYHRFHAPFDLHLEQARYLPGELLATNPAALQREPRVYCRNERIVLAGHGPYGPFRLVAVGATVVGRVRLHAAPLRTNRGDSADVHRFTPPLPIRKGEELGLFEMGSTMILIVAGPSLSAPQPPLAGALKMGETLWDPTI